MYVCEYVLDGAVCWLKYGMWYSSNKYDRIIKMSFNVALMTVYSRITVPSVSGKYYILYVSLSTSETKNNKCVAIVFAMLCGQTNWKSNESYKYCKTRQGTHRRPNRNLTQEEKVGLGDPNE